MPPTLPAGTPSASRASASSRRPTLASNAASDSGRHLKRRQQADSAYSDQTSKRVRSQADTPAGGATMSGRQIIDLVTPPKVHAAFNSNNAPKKLVVKNLRQSDRSDDINRYYDKIRRDLSQAVEAIFADQEPRVPRDRLYRSVEDLCRHKDSHALYLRLREAFEKHLAFDLRQSVTAELLTTDVDKLRSVLKHWRIWNRQCLLIRSIFSFLDRSYLLHAKDLPRINDLAITLFRRLIFDVTGLGSQVLTGICDLVEYDRRGDARFDPVLLRDSISMMHVLNVYTKMFEPRFLDLSATYFTQLTEELKTSSLKVYIMTCKERLAREGDRCSTYNFDSTTKHQLMEKAHKILIENYSEKLVHTSSVSKLLDENSIESMHALYNLLRLSGIQKMLKQPWEEYIKYAGALIVTDVQREDNMVVRLLELRRALDVMVRDAFYEDETFTWGLREAFASFLNDKSILSVWATGTSKVGEMISKYIDMLLRGGLKTLPKSLLSDSKDRAAAERSGQATTGDEDAELDRQLDQAVELFRFIQGKAVFEAFYKQDLARRLLMSRSASADAERSMLSKLRSECGSAFTHNLEQMFKDQELAREEMRSYQSWRESHDHPKESVDLSVNILSSAAWPTYQDSTVRVPREVLKQLETFHSYYKNKHTGRKLTWKHSLANCVVKAKFNKGTKELLVSAYQAIVLTLFNQIEDQPDGFLGYTQIAEASGLTGPDLDRTLQSLACGKTRVLTKHPKGKEVKDTDTFTVNKGFVDSKFRVKINQVQLKETKEENQDTHNKVASDRLFETQAAVVRIMKSRKTMTHANLMAEVINQTKSRGPVNAPDIKQTIEKLIDKDYLERLDGGMYAYLA